MCGKIVGRFLFVLTFSFVWFSVTSIIELARRACFLLARVVSIKKGGLQSMCAFRNKPRNSCLVCEIVRKWQTAGLLSHTFFVMNAVLFKPDSKNARLVLRKQLEMLEKQYLHALMLWGLLKIMNNDWYRPWMKRMKDMLQLLVYQYSSKCPWDTLKKTICKTPKRCVSLETV